MLWMDLLVRKPFGHKQPKGFIAVAQECEQQEHKQ